MKWTGLASSYPLLAAAAGPSSAWRPGTSVLFLASVATAAAVASEGSECPGGTSAVNGECVAIWDEDEIDSEDSSDDEPDSSDDDSSDDEDSSDDDDDNAQRRSGNPHAHRDDALDPADNEPSCDRYIDLRGYRTVAESASFYQNIEWSEHYNESNEALDVCMTLDEIVQICSSYRPHYHEPFVHFPAAYLEDMKRVAFIGGGDAMLLHECLKYPNVELVLGLELDQKNVRESLKHFRVQPHFDDDRVQWWFGDAAKSLALLPREWFGTFDLVMVDLSETGMSLSVNNDLDIFGALALLLKPGGILVKNEDYFSQMSKYFDYTVSVYMDANPVLCDQDWAMGSNGADFLRPKLDGGLVERYGIDDTMAYLPLEGEDEHYKMIIDYAHNDARAQGLCDEDDAANAGADGGENAAVKQTKSMGILLVAEAENASKGLDLEAFTSTLGALGMTVLESLSTPKDGGGSSSSVFIGMEEGYISAHSYPEMPTSVGFDFLLWSKLNKQDDVLRSLLGVVGADETSHSSYRVIHGGMKGYKHWEVESRKIGPVKKNVRHCGDGEARKTTDDDKSAEHFGLVVSESLSQMLSKRGEKAVAILCGVKGVDDCRMLESLRQHENIDRVIPIWACPDSAGEAENGDAGDHVYACGQEDIHRSAKAEEGYSALIVDPAAPDSLVDIAREIFCSDKIRRSKSHAFLRNRVVFATLLDGDARASMFAQCLRYVSKHLNRSGTVVVDHGTEVGLVVSANDGFVRQLIAVADSVKTRTGLSVEIEKMKSGQVPFQHDFDPVYHSANAYEQLAGLKQYTVQTPLASQSVYQLQVDADDVQQLSRSFAREVMDVVVEGYQSFAKSNHRYFEVGDGSVAAALSSTGHIYIIWDGGEIFTINVLTEGEKYERVVEDGETSMILVDHKAEVVDIVLNSLPSSAAVVAHEQMPRGSNNVVNFKTDIDAVHGCADHYESCKQFAQNGRCDAEKHQSWMHQYCALSCGACGEMKRESE